MAQWLKQSTAVTVMIGPFLDEDDGKTAEVALTLTQPDIRLSKNGAAFAQKNSVQTLTHDENGYYSLDLSNVDTNALGRLTVHVNESGALPVWYDFMVIDANAFNSIVLGTDVLDVSLVEIIGSATSATDLKDFVDAGYDPATNTITAVLDVTNAVTVGTINANVIDAVAIAAGAIDAAALATDAIDKISDGVWDENIVAAHGAADAAGRALRTLDAISDRANNSNLNAMLGVADTASETMLELVEEGCDLSLDNPVPGSPTADSVNERIRTIDDLLLPMVSKTGGSINDGGPSTTSFICAGLGDVDNFYNGMLLVFNDAADPNTGVGRRVLDWDFGTLTITLERALPVTPTNGDTFIMYAKDQAGLADVAGAVLDEDMTGHQTQGTLGQAIGDPAADATTLYQAVVTDADGDNVAVDVKAIKAETVLIVADTGELQTDDLPGLIATVQADLNIITGINGVFIDDVAITSAKFAAGAIDATAIANGAIDAATFATGAIDANALATDAVEEIRDSILTTAQTEEPAATIPPSNPSMKQMAMYAYMNWRNDNEATATERRLKNNAGTVIAKATMADDATTFNQGEMVAGP